MKRKGGRPKGVSSLAIEPETLGFRLRQIRESERLSLAEMADSMDVAADSQGNYERNQRSPDAEYLRDFCQRYRVSADWLLFGSGDQRRQDPEKVPYDPDKMQFAMELAGTIEKAGRLVPGKTAPEMAREIYEFFVSRD